MFRKLWFHNQGVHKMIVYKKRLIILLGAWNLVSCFTCRRT